MTITIISILLALCIVLGVSLAMLLHTDKKLTKYNKALFWEVKKNGRNNKH